MRIYPVVFVWRTVEVVDVDGVATRVNAMVPIARYGKVAERQYHVDEEYALAPLEARSRASHNQYFAAISDGYDSLPEKLAHRWKNDDHFRKWALIELGWFDETEIELQSPRHANRLMTRLIDYAKQQGIYVRVIVEESRVLIRTARSQAAAAMGKDDFERSKRAVLDLIEHMVGVSKGALMKNAGKHA